MQIRKGNERMIYKAANMALSEINSISYDSWGNNNTSVNFIGFGDTRIGMIAMKALSDSPEYKDKTAIVTNERNYRKATKELNVQKVEMVDSDTLKYLKGIDYAFIGGTDQIDMERYMISGGLKNMNDPSFGGSPKMEKDFIHNTGRGPVIVIASDSKTVPYLGYKRYAVPMEFPPGNEKIVKDFIEDTLSVKGLAKKLKKRTTRNGGFFVTENDMHVFDVPFDGRLYRNQMPFIEHTLEDFEYINSTGLFASKKPDSIKMTLNNDVMHIDSYIYQVSTGKIPFDTDI